MHRLDRDTSGVLVVAKKRSALTELQALMREEGGIAKRYLALLVGRMPDGMMTVDAPLHIGLRQGGERHVQVNAAGKPSVSHFKVLERRGGQSYCEVRIETGRTHQIRVHAQHIGHPVAGDDKYGDAEANKRLREQVGLKRMFLHASTLEFALDKRQGAVPAECAAGAGTDRRARPADVSGRRSLSEISALQSSTRRPDVGGVNVTGTCNLRRHRSAADGGGLELPVRGPPATAESSSGLAPLLRNDRHLDRHAIGAPSDTSQHHLRRRCCRSASSGG